MFDGDGSRDGSDDGGVIARHLTSIEYRRHYSTVAAPKATAETANSTAAASGAAGIATADEDEPDPDAVDFPLLLFDDEDDEEPDDLLVPFLVSSIPVTKSHCCVAGSMYTSSSTWVALGTMVMCIPVAPASCRALTKFWPRDK